ncbi:hypothetical protein VUR80DRAFT_2816 [Thermomyces stellatus]
MPVADNLFPKDQNKIDPDICKYFGDSTPDGIQFQFRSIKKDAQSMKAAADSGEDPSAALNLTASTPSSKRSPAKSTPGTARSTATVKSTGGRKRKTPVKLEPSEGETSEEVDYKARDLTPTPAPRPAKRTKNTAVDLTSESDESASTPADINNSITSSLVTEESKSAATQSQSFYEDSFVSGVGMNDVLLNSDAMESFYPVGEI